MCGIVGQIILEKGHPQEALIREMMLKIKHRGPDDEGVFIEDKIGLGHVRLSIIDLTTAGHQPMFSEDNNLILVFNGEIYNYLELKEELNNKYNFRTKTDTEVILAAYQVWGKDCLHKFNGDWAFAIYNRQNKTVFAARDRYGIKPLFYKLDKNELRFASEIKSLINKTNNNPNYENIYDYLVFNRTDHNNKTFFEDIKKLEHGCYFFIKEGKIEFQKWYNLHNQLNLANNNRIISGNPIGQFRNLLSSAISLRLRSDVPVGVCLSGGLDSSTIVSILLNNFQKYELNTFSAVYKNHKHADESEFINLYAPLLKNMNYTYPNAKTFFDDLNSFIEAQTEPVATIGPYAQYKVMELAKENVSVSIDGQGADELLAGYHYFFGTYFKELFNKFKLVTLLNEIYKYYKNHKSTLAYKYWLYYVFPNSFKNKIGSKLNSDLSHEFYTKHYKNSEIGNKLYSPKDLNSSLINHFEYKLEHLLKWEDHNSMHFSIESRVPFLDHRLVEYVLNLNSDFKIKDGNTKYILRQAMKNILPIEILNRQDKKGFSTPSDLWFKEDNFQQLITDLLNSSSFKERGIFNYKDCLKRYNNHISNDNYSTLAIWKWINLELWFRQYID